MRGRKDQQSHRAEPVPQYEGVAAIERAGRHAGWPLSDGGMISSGVRRPFYPAVPSIRHG
jgi:hypothetical protein